MKRRKGWKNRERGKNKRMNKWTTKKQKQKKEKTKSTGPVPFSPFRAFSHSWDGITALEETQWNNDYPLDLISTELRRCRTSTSVHQNIPRGARELWSKPRGWGGQAQHMHPNKDMGWGQLFWPSSGTTADPPGGFGRAMHCTNVSREAFPVPTYQVVTEGRSNHHGVSCPLPYTAHPSSPKKS